MPLFNLFPGRWFLWPSGSNQWYLLGTTVRGQTSKFSTTPAAMYPDSVKEAFPTALERNTTHETCSWPRPFIVGRGEAVWFLLMSKSYTS